MNEAQILGAITAIIAIVCYLWGRKTGRIEGYKDGQIDAANQNIKYKLIEFENKTREWVKESELCDYENYKIIDKL